MMNRRAAMRAAASTLALGFAGRLPARSEGPKKRLLVYTRSQTFEHDVVRPGKNGEPSLCDRVWTDLAAKHGFEVECTKDGRIFLPETLKKFDAFFFCTTGDLTKGDKAGWHKENVDGSPPMPPEGKKALLNAIASGKGFIGSHCASDTFHSPGEGPTNQPSDQIDPYIKMLGGEFISHGDQQKATMKVVDPGFPGMKGQGDFTLNEEWYSLKNFAPDLHVILVNETSGMKNWQYLRPPFPATWARMHGKGRVYFTSMGHRDDVWKNPIFQNMLAGAFLWTTGQVDADVSPNMARVTPQAMEMPKQPPPEPKPADSSKSKN